MEAFTLLKYWHTLFSSTTHHHDDDGPFFDLECLLQQPTDVLEFKHPTIEQLNGANKGPLLTLFARENCSKDLDSSWRWVNKEVEQDKCSKLLVKPLHYVEKQIKCSGGLGKTVSSSLSSSSAAHQKYGQSNGSLKARNLGKSRSSSELVAPAGKRPTEEMQEGLQGAILYCKRSYSMPPQGQFVPLDS